MPDAQDFLDDAKSKVEIWGAMCHRCRAGHPGECVSLFDSTITCPEEKVTLNEWLRAISALDAGAEPVQDKPKRKTRSALVDAAGPEPDLPAVSKYKSGYIELAAWVFSKDIGDFADPTSTGRKAIADLYPIQPGQICDWAWMKNCGGAVIPIMGCPGHPASDLHHGPDKNTLNNTKASRGIGTSENAWAICSFCHNAFHAANDAYYPPYDRIAQQAQPWLPQYPEGFVPFVMETADPDEVLAEEARRKKEHTRHGVTRLGRNARATGPAGQPGNLDAVGADGPDE